MSNFENKVLLNEANWHGKHYCIIYMENTGKTKGLSALKLFHAPKFLSFDTSLTTTSAGIKFMEVIVKSEIVLERLKKKLQEKRINK